MKDQIGGLASVDVVATLRVVKHPKCGTCGAANPQGLPRCVCGARLETATEVRDETSIALTDRDVPLLARVLLAIGQRLRAFAERINGG